MRSRLRKQAMAWVPVTLGVFAALVSSCDSIAVTSVAVTAVEVFPTGAELVVGQSVQLSALALDGAGVQIGTAAIEWDASPPEMAQVDASGRVTALAPGVATIRATSGGMVGTAGIAIGVPGVLFLTQSELQLSATVGEAPPPPVAIQIASGNEGVVLGLAATVTYGTGDVDWLAATLNTDRAPAVLRMAAGTRALAPGIYTARVDISSSSATNGTQSVRVILAVADPLPIIEASPTMLSLVGTETQSVQVRNVGPGILTGLTAVVEYSPDGPQGWLAAATSSHGAPASVVIGSDDSGLPPGIYSARVWIGSVNTNVAPVAIDVRLDGGKQAPVLVVGVGAAALTAAVGGAASVTINISNGGTGQLDGLRSTVGYAPGQPTGWLTGSLSSTAAPSRLALVASASGLSAGTYTASVEVVGHAPNSPVLVPVTFTVTGAPAQGVPAAPSGLVVVATSSWSVSLSWSDNSSNESTFDVRKRGASGHWQIWRTTPPNVTALVDSGVGPASAYDYQVRACNASGCSAWTPLVSVTTP